MTAATSYRDTTRLSFPGMRTERLLRTRFYRNRTKARRRLFISVYGRMAMFRQRYAALRSKKIAVIVALIKALTAKRIEQRFQVHKTYQPPRVLKTQRR